MFIEKGLLCLNLVLVILVQVVLSLFVIHKSVLLLLLLLHLCSLLRLRVLQLHRRYYGGGTGFVTSDRGHRGLLMLRRRWALLVHDSGLVELVGHRLLLTRRDVAHV